MKASAKRITSILISMLLFIAVLVLYMYLIKPAFNDIGDKRAEIAGKLALIDEYNAALTRIQDLLRQYDNLTQIQEAASSVLPPEQNLPRSINQISGLASINRLSIGTLSVQQMSIKPSLRPSLVKGLGTLRLSTRLTGDYQSFKSFLENLETNVNLMDVVSLKIEPLALKVGSSVKTAVNINNFNYTLVADTYYQAE